MDEEPVTPPAAPTVTVTGATAVNYEENSTVAVGTYTSSVANVIWSLSGDDADDFEISSGERTELHAPRPTGRRRRTRTPTTTTW